MKTLAAAVLCLLACACESTSFQTPPLAQDAGCDPALPGHWQSVDGAGHPNDEMKLAIGADCSLSVVDRDGTRLREGEPTTLRLARANGLRYAWVTAGWADLRFEASEDVRADPADVYLFRYDAEGDALRVHFINHKAVAHRIIDGAIPGTARVEDRTIVNRITGPAHPELLVLPDLFDDEPMHFRREPGTP